MNTKLVQFGCGVTLAVGVTLFFRNVHIEDTRPLMSAICLNSAECSEALDNHFDRCFGKSFKGGGRYTGTSELYTAELVACLNSSTGKTIFSEADVYATLKSTSPGYTVLSSR